MIESTGLELEVELAITQTNMSWQYLFIYFITELTNVLAKEK